VAAKINAFLRAHQEKKRRLRPRAEKLLNEPVGGRK
jgi:hypothetical protein